jgi:hypothetical protein
MGDKGGLPFLWAEPEALSRVSGGPFLSSEGLWLGWQGKAYPRRGGVAGLDFRHEDIARLDVGGFGFGLVGWGWTDWRLGAGAVRGLGCRQAAYDVRGFDGDEAGE